MTKSRTNPQVDAYLRGAKKWRKEMATLRRILLGFELTEELKWGKPCYAFEGGNIVVILPLKEHCTLLLCKGALLKDDHGILIKAGENTQAARQIRLKSLEEIVEKEAILKTYLHQAIAVEKAGLEVEYKKISDFPIPGELQKKLKENPALKTAFAALTPGRQRGYFIYFSAAKQSKTREARIEKSIPQILDGKGLNDEYRSVKK